MRGTATGTRRALTARPRAARPIFTAEEIACIERKLGYSFRNPELLAQALIHRSYLNEVRAGDNVSHNERLEFLGDAVLEMAVTQFLYRTCRELREGKLTDIRAAMVVSSANAGYAEKIGLVEHVRLSRGERMSLDAFGKARTFILADAFEAVLGAIYLDRGMGAVEIFLSEIVFPHLQEVLDKRLYLDAKSHFQELVQERDRLTPRYHVVAEDGPDHDKEFTMAVYIGDRRVGTGVGGSKQEAQVEAAKDALQREFNIVLDESASAVGKH